MNNKITEFHIDTDDYFGKSIYMFHRKHGMNVYRRVTPKQINRILRVALVSGFEFYQVQVKANGDTSIQFQKR